SLGDGGRASQAILFPFDIDVDDAGNIYFHDASNLNGPNTDSAIRKIDTSGRITTVVGAPMGNAALAAPGDAADLRFGGFTGSMTVDGDGTIYLVIGNRILRVAPAGAVSLVAGTGASGYSGDGGPATEATLKKIGDLDLDAAGNLYVATANRVRMIDPDGVITT